MLHKNKQSGFDKNNPLNNPGHTNNNDSPTRKYFIVVCYDITDDKRRSRLHRKLKKFGIGAQYSVFECLLTRSRIQELRAMVKQTIKTTKGDRVRYYALCESCRKRIDSTDAVVDQDAPIIFV